MTAAAAVARGALAAVVVLACAFLVAPTLAVVPVSFTATDYITFPPQGVSLRWYLAFLTDAAWRAASVNSLVVAATSTTAATAIGTLAALGLGRLPSGLARVAAWLFLLPMIVPSIIVAVALYSAFAPVGLIGTRAGLVVAHTILALPFVVINVSAVLQRLDWRMVQAARSLGAGPAAAFRKVLLPAIAPGVLAGAAFAFLTSFDEVVVALFVTGVDSATLPVQMWNGIRFEVSPVVAAVSSLLLALAVVLLAGYGLLRRGGKAA